MKNTQGRMILLGLPRENACPRVYENGCTGGDTRGASVKESSVWTRLLICERDLTIDKRSSSRLCVVIGLFMGLFVGLTCSIVKMWGGVYVRCVCLPTAHATFLVCSKPICPML
jgi:hypothetical protein